MGKETHGRKCSFRPIAVILAVALLACGVVGGTVAWLIAETEPVVNTFTYGDIDLTLNETELDEDGNPVDDDNDGIPNKTEEGNDYEMIPGEEYLKDPMVTVEAGNEACWLFVKLDEQGSATVINDDGSTDTYDFDDYLSYEVIEGDNAWIQLKDENGNPVEGVYFRYVGEDTDDTGVTYQILSDNKISVKEDVTKDMLNALDNNGQNTENPTYPTLSITAYAVQYIGFEPAVDEGATEPTDDQYNAAALLAWKAVENQNTTTP